MNRQLPALALALAATAAALAACTDRSDPDWIEAETVQEAALPTETRASLDRELAGKDYRITDIDKETEDGERVYAIEVVTGGREKEYEITADGRILEIEDKGRAR